MGVDDVLKWCSFYQVKRGNGWQKENPFKQPDADGPYKMYKNKP